MKIRSSGSWRNWQTRMLEVHVPEGAFKVLSTAPVNVARLSHSWQEIFSLKV
jgi:hypothetical protein